MKRLLACLLLAAALVTNACALEVPTDTTVQNLNGSQQLIKTYTLPPGADPQTLIEDPFEQEGWWYTFADIVKEENHVSDRKYHTETVTLEISTKDLGTILTQLAATLDYDDGTYSGVLNLDHTAIRTEAAGYTSQAKTVTATKTIGPLDRNDMSYVPATTVKDGVLEPVQRGLAGHRHRLVGTLWPRLLIRRWRLLREVSTPGCHRVCHLRLTMWGRSPPAM